MRQYFFIPFLFLITIVQSIFANKEFISLFVPKHPVILEAGAHVGSDTIEMVSLWPGCTIHAFEPAPEIFKRLTKNTCDLPNVHRYPFALSDKNGTAVFYVSSGTSDGSSSLLMPKEHLNVHQTVHFTEVTEVETMTLDDWAERNKLDHIDFMWLDMQGHEFSMLKASPKILKTVKVIYLEISFQELYIGTALFPEVKEWLEEQGFKFICEIDENALFVRKDLPVLKELKMD